MGGLIRMCLYIFLVLFAFVFATPWRKAAMPSIFRTWIDIGAYNLTILKLPPPSITYNDPVDRKFLKDKIISLINNVKQHKTILAFGNKG
jgi:hypothetical protein